jgi:D-3-phosphoglycerate dehydrogenase
LSRLKIIGRGGVGMDNIDVDYAKQRNYRINTCSSSESVAELVLPIYFRAFLHDSNRTMPLEGFKL